MIKWVVAVLALAAGLAAVLWQLSAGGEAPDVAVMAFDAGPAAPGEPADAAPYTRRRPTIDARVEEAQADKLESTSEAFSAQLDVGIPDTFRASLARCNRANMDPDAKISIRYRLHIEEGVVSASRVKVEKSDLGDRELEDCMVAAIQQKRWNAPNLPDYSEDQDLFIRIRSLDKYLNEDEQKENKRRERAEAP